MSSVLHRFPHRLRLVTIACALAVANCVAGCVVAGDAKAPLTVRTIAATCTKPIDTLVVLLPGARDHADVFIAEGFVDALHSRGIAADVVLADASVAYYTAGTIVQRLDTDVIEPARARGIKHIWLAGISIGGLGSLIYANERGGTVDGLLLIAPYLGEPPIIKEIEAAGGLRRWTPPADIAPEDHDHRLWKWLKTLTPSTRLALRSGDDLPPVWLGYGRDDRFVDAHRLLAAALPKDHVFTAPGGHDWPPWRAVWADLLDNASLPRDPSCVKTR